MSLFSLFGEDQAQGPFTILTVCTGNICRSPLTEGLLRMVLAGLPVRVHSAGTAALIGDPMTEQNQIIARELGVTDEAEHRARQLSADHLSDSDLVLALTRDHRRQIVELLPRASRKVFTLREFARLAAAFDFGETPLDPSLSVEGRMREAVEFVAQLRGTVPPPLEPADDDVVDPYRRDDEVYARSAQQIVPSVNATALLLRRASANSAA